MNSFSRLMAACSLGCVLAGPVLGQDADPDARRELINQGTVGILAGSYGGTYLKVAWDLSNAYDDGFGLRILPIAGKGSVRNIEDLLYLRGIDIAIVQSDVLDFYKQTNVFPNIESQVRYIAKLYNEEMHLLTRREFTSIDQLANRKVSFGPDASGTFMTSSLVFDSLGLAVDVQSASFEEAAVQLRTGEIDGMVVIAGKPATVASDFGADADVHLISVPPDRVSGAYVPVTLTAADYPNLVAEGETIDTIAVGAVMAAYNWPADHERGRRVNHFVDTFYKNIEILQQQPSAYHPKWAEIDFESELPGWTKLEAVAQLRASQ